MVEQRQIQKLLHEKLTAAKLHNSAYSLRAMAKRIGISSAALSEILSGKRRVSKKMVLRFAEKLNLNPQEINSLLQLFPEKRTYSSQQTLTNSTMMQLNMDHFRVISDWYHFAILSLAETKGFKSNPQWIAQRLNIKKRDAESALERLERLEMLDRDANGKLKCTGIQYTTSDEVVNSSLQRSHLQNLELARLSLEKNSINERDFTAITMAIDLEKIPQAKKMIRQFRDQLCNFLESGRKKEVYRFCMQLIPLSNLKGNK